MAEMAMFVLLFLATGFDIRTKKIPNALLFMGLLFILAYTAFLGGASGAFLAGARCILTIFFCFPFFRLHAIGAGDIKLLALIAALHGMERLLEVSFIMFTCASLFILWKFRRTGMIRNRIQYFIWYVRAGRYTGEVYFSKVRDGDEAGIILAPFATIGYFIVCIERWWKI